MRHLYHYQVIRYFPNISSDEFFNVGIYLMNENKRKLHFIENDHLAKLFAFPSIDKKHLISFIELLNNEKEITQWYGNNLRFSEKKRLRSHQEFEFIIAMLYEDYIGYKFHIKEKQDPIEFAKQKAIQIVHSEFKSQLSITDNDFFDLEIIAKKNHKHHYSKFGSIGNQNHFLDAIVKKAKILSTHSSIDKVFDFLNIHEDPTATVGTMLLNDNKINNISFDSEQHQIEYFKNVAGF